MKWGLGSRRRFLPSQSSFTERSAFSIQERSDTAGYRSSLFHPKHSLPPTKQRSSSLLPGKTVLTNLEELQRYNVKQGCQTYSLEPLYLACHTTSRPLKAWGHRLLQNGGHLVLLAIASSSKLGFPLQLPQTLVKPLDPCCCWILPSTSGPLPPRPLPPPDVPSLKPSSSLECHHCSLSQFRGLDLAHKKPCGPHLAWGSTWVWHPWLKGKSHLVFRFILIAQFIICQEQNHHKFQ